MKIYKRVYKDIRVYKGISNDISKNITKEYTKRKLNPFPPTGEREMTDSQPRDKHDSLMGEMRDNKVSKTTGITLCVNKNMHISKKCNGKNYQAYSR